MASPRRPAGELAGLVRMLLEREQRPLAGLAIVRLLREAGEAVPPSAVFRALRGLAERGEVRKLLLARGYVLAGRADAIHLCCTRCGSIEPVPAGVLAAIGDAARAGGFRIRHVIVEVPGICARCRGAGPV